VNGSEGKIVGFEPYDENKLPKRYALGGRHASYCEAEINFYADENRYTSWPIVKFDNGETRTIYPGCSATEYGTDEPFSLLSRTQIPLMAGYAITVHKAQVSSLSS
jgi:ATP-dependent DNA helicase PIF1